MTSDCAPEILTLFCNVTVPVVAPPIPLRVVAAIVAVLVVAWKAVSVIVTSDVPADTVLLPLTRASVN